MKPDFFSGLRRTVPEKFLPKETLEPGGGFYVLDELFSEKKPQADDGGGIRGDGRFVFFVFCR